MMQSFCEMVIQQKQAANIDPSPPQEMSIQVMEDLKQQRGLKFMIDDGYEKNSMDMCIKINKKNRASELEQADNLSTYTYSKLRDVSIIFIDDDDLRGGQNIDEIPDAFQDMGYFLRILLNGYHDSEGHICLESLLLKDHYSLFPHRMVFRV
ncbi:hypothetical protein Tco_0858616 [Tanacetum coccineum]|uniref:Uncharacterized protein n=1 Tax=Tanacetum coccineum TaxID=301880 RepID=A0ABQ5BFB7_9ASTR